MKLLRVISEPFIKGIPLILLPISLLAQEDSVELSDRIVTVGDWEPRIGQVEKIKAEPNPVDTVPPEPEVNYSFKPAHYKTTYHVKPIEAARLKVKDPLDRLDKGYFRLGIGTFTTPVGDAYYSSDRDRDHQYSARLFHRSSKGGVKGNDHADWSRNGMRLRGKWTDRRSSWKAGLGYSREVRHHYGFPVGRDTLDVLKDQDLRQRFHDFNGNVEWKKYTKDSNKTDHRHSLDLNHFRTLENASESNADLDLRFDRFVKEEHLRLKAGIDHNIYEKPLSGEKGTNSLNNSLVHITPNIVSKGENWQVEVGMKVLSEISDQRNTGFHFYPQADAHYVLFDGIFVPYAGIGGGMKRNNLRSLSMMNPHIKRGQDLRNTNRAYDLYGGVRGSLSKHLNFDLRASKKKLDHYPLLVNDSLEGSLTPGNRFRAIYEGGELIEVKGDLSFYQGERLKLDLTGSYRDYRLDEQERAWHRPIFQSSLNGWYDIQDKFTVQARFRYVGPRKALSRSDLEGTERENNAYIVDLPAFVDLNLGFEYRYTKDLAAYIRFNNILGDRYQRWYGYPVQGFQVLGGLTYSL